MNDATLLEQAGRILEPWARETRAPEPERLDVVVDAADLSSAVAALQAARWGYLAALTGLDQGAEQDVFELLYHFCAASAVLTLRVRIPRAAPSVASICGIIPSASSFERELAEMFGVVVVGTPDPSRLYIADDWPVDVFPLRKDVVA
jgi:Ni,Fe-hydrogenase III component G